MNQQARARRADAVLPSRSAHPPARGAFAALVPELQRAVAELGYDTPTPIQEQAIPALLEGRDLIGSAQTGTGKTAAFTLPLLQRLSRNGRRPRRGAPRALILAPTRELAAQIGESIRDYGRHLRVSHTVVFGGVSQHGQVKAMNRGVDVLVATPGRLLDLMGQGFIDLSEVEVFILDEVDRMLDMGFLPDIKRVIAQVPERRQTLFLSATLAPKMMALADSLVRNAVRVDIEPEAPAVERIEQRVLFMGQHSKPDALIALLRKPDTGRTIVFTQMKHVANRVVDALERAGIRGAAIHGNKSQAARTKALDGFRRGRFQVLVATDVAARGLDVDDITHVVNYDLPLEAETYVHRIGRTARAGAGGDAVSFCTVEDRAYLHDIERLLGQQVPADIDHAHHCEKARTSDAPAPKNFGRGSGGGGGGRNARGRGGAPRRNQRPRGNGRSRGRR